MRFCTLELFSLISWQFKSNRNILTWNRTIHIFSLRFLQIKYYRLKSDNQFIFSHIQPDKIFRSDSDYQNISLRFHLFKYICKNSGNSNIFTHLLEIKIFSLRFYQLRYFTQILTIEIFRSDFGNQNISVIFLQQKYFAQISSFLCLPSYQWLSKVFWSPIEAIINVELTI